MWYHKVYIKFSSTFLLHFVSIWTNLHLKPLQIQVRGNSSKVLAELTLSVSTNSILLNNLTSRGAYSVRVACFTGAGLGPWSQHITLFPGHAGGLRASAVPGDTWLLLVVVLFAVLLALACSTVLYLRKRTANKQLGHLAGNWTFSTHLGPLSKAFQARKTRS